MRRRADAPDTSSPEPGLLSWVIRRVADRRGPVPLPPALLDALPDPVVVVDAEDRVQAAGCAVGERFGIAPEALVGSGLADMLFARADRLRYQARRDALADAQDAAAPEALAVVHADGSDVPVAVTLAPVPGTDWVSVTLRPTDASRPGDAEGRIEAVDARRRTLRTILDTLPDPVLALDRAGRVLFRNEAGAEGLMAPEAPVSEAEWRAAEAVMAAGRPVVGREEADSEGGVRLTTRVPVRGAAGDVVGLVATSRDVTAERADAARLIDEKRAAEAAARAGRETLATTSHEVRTLMSGVTGMTTLLLDTALGDEQREYVETIRSSSASLLRIVNDVLDLSKMDAGMLALEAEPFAVGRVVADALAVVSQQAGAKGVALSCDVAPDTPDVVVGDAVRVQQVLANLLTNAVKFTDEGAVRVRVESVPGRLAFAVEDTGVGIAPDRLEAVFEPFAQAETSTARTHGGTGLGLAICRRLVEMMGGELTAESTPSGSVFRFTVALGARPPASAPSEAASEETPSPSAEPAPAPLTVQPLASAPGPSDAAAPPPPAPSPEPEPERPRVAPPPRQKTMDMGSMLPSASVLLVEDDPVMQKVTAHTLKRLGYLPTVVDNGRKGVLAVRSKRYDVVLMDVMMPVMDGLEATRQIRDDAGPHGQPAIVMLTANAMKGDRERGAEAGCDAYLTKPVDPRELAATIERAIRDRPAAPAPEADEDELAVAISA